jgi:hypothetical protein
MVDVVLSLGDDALSNQFKLVFPNGIPGGGNANAIELRMDQSFDIPQQTIYKYDIDFRGSKITKTGKKEETDKTVTFNVRLDSQWIVYDDLNAWFKMTYDPVTNIALPDLLVRTTIEIHALNSAGDSSKVFKMRNSKITDLKIGTFDNTTGDPIRLEVTITYGTLE